MCRRYGLRTPIAFFVVVGGLLIGAPIAHALGWMSLAWAGTTVGLMTMLGAVYFLYLHPAAKEIPPRIGWPFVAGGLILIGGYAPNIEFNDQTVGELAGPTAADVVSVGILVVASALVAGVWFALDLYYDRSDDVDGLARSIKRRLRTIRDGR